jgi:hypothetical protein
MERVLQRYEGGSHVRHFCAQLADPASSASDCLKAAWHAAEDHARMEFLPGLAESGSPPDPAPPTPAAPSSSAAVVSGGGGEGGEGGHAGHQCALEPGLKQARTQPGHALAWLGTAARVARLILISRGPHNKAPGGRLMGGLMGRLKWMGGPNLMGGRMDRFSRRS